MSEMWRLLSGKLHRPDSSGQMIAYRAPFDFEPTAAELQANKFRMRKVADIVKSITTAIPAVGRSMQEAVVPDNRNLTVALVNGDVALVAPEGKTATAATASSHVTNVSMPSITVDIAETTQLDITAVGVKEAIEYIDKVISDEELDRIFLQEADNKPKARSTVTKAIEVRRSTLSVSYTT